MANEAITASTASRSLRARQVYGMAIACLLAGLAIGYLARASQAPGSATQSAANAASPAASAAASVSEQIPGAQSMPPMQAQAAVNPARPRHPAGAISGRMPTLEEMKQMADKQAAPLLEKLKTDPNNSAVLVEVGAIYHSTHQFKEAAAYYQKAVKVDPGNVATRTKLASSLYRNGDVDGALAQLNRALSYDPNDANALFDLGMIKLQGKQDGKGALAAWQRLLKTNPALSSDRRATVEKLMADVLTSLGDQHAAPQHAAPQLAAQGGAKQ
ncbi:MAG: tetratricopeptide repeat protein [Terracidiphilus sp.]|jgi:cytochrome c-type biogenesis protein CcmH/NrfG